MPTNTDPPLVSSALPHPRYLLSRLQREWHQLERRPASVRRANSWDLAQPAITSLGELLVRTGLGDRSPSHTVAAREANLLLGRLMVAARTDELAARVVLQRLLPGLSAIGRRRSGGFGGHVAALDELLSASWHVIRTFPVERRPNHLASNLLRDVEYHAFRRSTRRLLVHEFTEPRVLDQTADAEHSIEPLDELLELIEIARRTHLADRDVQLLRLLLSAKSTRDVAVEMHVSERTVRNHRDAVVHRLRMAAAA